MTPRPAREAPAPAVVLDCADPEVLAGFWGNALGYRSAGRAGPRVTLHDPAGRRPDLLLHRVADPGTGRNRMHLELRADSVEPQLERLRDLGAAVLRGPFDDDGRLTTVLADPEGNEFRLVVPPGGREPAPHWPPGPRERP